MPTLSRDGDVFVLHLGDDENRYIRPADLDELCEALREIHADPAEANARAARLKEAVRRFDWSREKQRLLAAVDRP